MSVVLGKIAVALVFSLFAIALLFWKEKLRPWVSNKSHWAIISSWIAFRVLPFAVIYIFLNFSVKSDVIFFYDTAKQALAGLIVYRDFWQPYSPLFPYLNALSLAVIDSPKSIIFLMMIYELAAIYITKAIITNKDSVFYIILYLTLPAPLIFLIFGGQEDIFLWLFIALSVLVYKKHKNSFCVGITLGVGILCTKILLIIPIAILLIFSRSRIKILLGLLVVGIPAIAIMLYLTGEKILAPLELGDLPFAPNLVSVISPFIGGIAPKSNLLNWGGLIIIIAGACYYLRNLKPYGESRLLIFVFILTNMITIVVHKNSLPNYLYTILLPVIYFFGESFKARQWILMILLNVVGAVQPSLWYYLGGEYYNSFSSFSLLNAIEYALQIVYLAFCIYFIHFFTLISKGEINATFPE